MGHPVTVFDAFSSQFKYIFGVRSLNFLGHLVDTNSIHPLSSKTATILDRVNVYSRVFPNCADTIFLLKALFSGAKWSSELSADTLAVFGKTKIAPTDTTLLRH
ncbi:unnamed protein product [Dibothriocephalus latus]|uniref:Uncharacterized protein n=1 Tax=Dibothriocephalus latus TaxID=60516 RepID=A0A3P6UDP2_DIBLA|nr:unnamed protein product [Dibothriocephalus latus]